jgi:hypothetical protein
MSHDNYALERCQTYGLSPEDALRTHFAITTGTDKAIAGLTAMTLDRCMLHSGADVQVIPMEDTKGRLFGAFIGIGVDRDGAQISAEAFHTFNSKSPLFAKTFTKFLGEIAGRYAVLLDMGKTRALYTDPMGHMALFYNPQTGRVSSAEYLVLDGPAAAGPASGPIAPGPDALARTFPMGQGLDAHTALIKGGHMLDLSSFEQARVWPVGTSLRKVTKSKSGPVIDQMAKRLKAVVGALAASRPCTVMLDARPEDRLLLAALKASGTEVAQVCATTAQGEAPHPLDLMLADRAGYPLDALSTDAARRQFAGDPPARQRLKRLYWVRTGCALRVPREALTGLGGLRPKGALALCGAGFDAVQGGWMPGSEATPTSRKPSQAEEFALLLGHDPDAQQAKAIIAPYKAWKSSLPKSFQPLAADFIRLEMHQPAQAVAWHGETEQMHLSPFSDRLFIEQALRLPVEMRAGPALIEALVKKLAPELANLPHPGDSDEGMVQAA